MCFQNVYIGVAGQKQNGKDTIADYIVEPLNSKEFKQKMLDTNILLMADFERDAFAKNVKKVFIETFGGNYEFIEEWKTNPEPPPGFDMNVRSALQFIGDGFRKIKSSIWVDLMFNGGNKIISDVRYINEAKRIFDYGGFNLLIAHPDRVNDDPNGSESQIKPYVEWCLKNMPESGNPNTPELLALPDRPEDMELFSYFVRNDQTIQDLYSLADKEIIPFVKTKILEINNDDI